MAFVLLVILVVLCAGAFPQNGWHPYGYYPAGGLGLVVVVLLLLMLLGYL